MPMEKITGVSEETFSFVFMAQIVHKFEYPSVNGYNLILTEMPHFPLIIDCR